MAHADYPVSIFSLFHANNAEFYPSVTVNGQSISQYSLANAFYFNQTADVYHGANPVYTKSTTYSPETLSVSSAAYWNLDSWFNTSGVSGSFGYLIPNTQIAAGQPVTITYTDLAGGNTYPSPYSTYLTLGLEVANGYAFLLPAPYTINWYSSTTPPTISGSFSESDTSIVPSYDVDTQFASGICEAQTGGTLIGSTTMSSTQLPNNHGDYGWTGSMTVSAPSTPTYYYGVISFGSVLLSPSAGVISGAVGSNLELCTLPILISPPKSNTPTLSASPSVSATYDTDATPNIAFTVSNIGGGTPPYTVSTVGANSQTSTSPIGLYTQATGVTAGSATMVFPIGSERAGYPVPCTIQMQYFMAKVQDSAGQTTLSSPPNLGLMTINPILTPNATISEPALPATMQVGGSIIFADAWQGGTPPYTAVLTISNSVTNAVITTQTVSGISGTITPISIPGSCTGNTMTASASFIFTPTATMLGNTIHANVTVTDSAAIPTTHSSVYSGVLSFGEAANVLIVTTGIGDQTPNANIAAYQNALASQGLSSLFVELDQVDYTTYTGASPLPAGSSWQHYKSAINNLETLTGATYVVILGDATILPMPAVPAAGDMIPTDEKQDLKVAGQALLPTDDPYGTTGSSTIPNIVVARMPGGTGQEIGGMLQNAVNARTKGNTKLGIFTDTSVESFLNDLTSADIFAATAKLQQTCSGGNPDCFQSPPYCMQLSNGNPCTNAAQLETQMASYGIQFYNCHGSGFVCGGSTANSPLLLLPNQMPQMGQNPVVITDACYGAEIPGTYIYGSLFQYDGEVQGSKTMAVGVLDAGASAYVGWTEVGLAAIGRQKLSNSNSGATTTVDSVIDANLYNKFKSGQTIGQAFLNEKQYFEQSSKSSEADVVDVGTTMVLYGDPTITYSGLG